jgi:hypothetical protein
LEGGATLAFQRGTDEPGVYELVIVSKEKHWQGIQTKFIYQ